MGAVPSYFERFLQNIRLTDNQIQDLKTGHETLRERLENDPDLSKIIIGTFLQGSYRRATAVRPKGDERPDVDVVVVTNLDKNNTTPEEALAKFEPFLKKHYPNKYKKQNRSWGIELSYVSLDLVPATITETTDSKYELLKAFANVSLKHHDLEQLVQAWFITNQQSWKSAPIWIPDRKASEWIGTDPLAQIQATHEKNASCNGHYVNVVKALKWWRINNNPDDEQPKSYPLERLIYEVCPNNITSVAQGVTELLKTIVSKFKTKPVLPDHGLPDHDVFKDITDDEYERFYNRVVPAAKLAQRAYEEDDVTRSVLLWRELFGDRFPKPPNEGGNGGKGSGPSTPIVGGYTPRQGDTTLGTRRFGQ